VSMTARLADRRTVELDVSVPALLLKLGHYPLHHGGVGVVRSLGRVGIEVNAVVEDRFTPAAWSRHLTRAFVWPTTGAEDPSSLVETLMRIGRDIGRPAVVVPTDEEAAVLVAEHADVLGEVFLVDRSRTPGLVRSLASKRGLYELCLEHDVPTAETWFPESLEEIEKYAQTGAFPVVVKNREAFGRRAAPVVRSTTIVATPEELRSMAVEWQDPPGVVLQEHIPRDFAEDWFVHSYVGRNTPGVLFTGIKIRSWPPHAGMTSCAYAVWNPELAALARRLYTSLGYAGLADLDFRLDRRDGQYKLVDFNPRVGAQFRIFENAAGVDVVRAQHLALTGRPIPEAPFPEGRRLVVENVDLAARLGYRHRNRTAPHAPRRATETELGWFAPDDPLPLVPMLLRHVTPLVSYVGESRRARHNRTRGQR
jgi:D-aspartate ligase